MVDDEIELIVQAGGPDDATDLRAAADDAGVAVRPMIGLDPLTTVILVGAGSQVLATFTRWMGTRAKKGRPSAGLVVDLRPDARSLVERQSELSHNQVLFIVPCSDGSLKVKLTTQSAATELELLSQNMFGILTQHLGDTRQGASAAVEQAGLDAGGTQIEIVSE